MNGSVSGSQKSLASMERSSSRQRERSKSQMAGFPRIKREHGEDIKDYAATTMNEILGWYGYDKFDSRETQALNLHHLGPLSSSSTTNSGSNSPTRSGGTPTEARRSSSPASDTREQSLIDVEEVVEEVGLGLCHSPDPSLDLSGRQGKEANKDFANMSPDNSLCAWCQKPASKFHTLQTANGCKAFCSDICFAQCRRASFKKNKVCHWCKHVRHTVNYVDFQDGDQQLQFCSEKCLTQYKINIFLRETHAHLQSHPDLRESSSEIPQQSNNSGLITPDLWLANSKRAEGKTFGNENSEEDEKQERIPNNSKAKKRKEPEIAYGANADPQEGEAQIRLKQKEKDFKRRKRSALSSTNSSEEIHWSKDAKESLRRHATAAASSRNTSEHNSSVVLPIQLVSRSLKRSPPLRNHSVSSTSTPMASSAFNNASSSRFPTFFRNGLHPGDHPRPPPVPPFVSGTHPSFGEIMMRIQHGLHNPVPYFNSGIRGPVFSPITHLPPHVNISKVPNSQPPPQNVFQQPIFGPHNRNSTTNNNHVTPPNPFSVPPVTVMVPHPIFLPFPLPIPIPLPIPMKRLDQNSKDIGTQTTLHDTGMHTNGMQVENGITKHKNGLHSPKCLETSSDRSVDSLATKLANKKFNGTKSYTNTKPKQGLAEGNKPNLAPNSIKNGICAEEKTDEELTAVL